MEFYIQEYNSTLTCCFLPPVIVSTNKNIFALYEERNFISHMHKILHTHYKSSNEHATKNYHTIIVMTIGYSTETLAKTCMPLRTCIHTMQIREWAHRKLQSESYTDKQS